MRSTRAGMGKRRVERSRLRSGSSRMICGTLWMNNRSKRPMCLAFPMAEISPWSLLRGIRNVVDRLILDGANLDTGGVKRSIQIPIEVGYRLAKLFSGKSESAKQHAEMLGLMVNDPNIKPVELAKVQAKTLVIAGTRDMVRDAHTRLIARNIPNCQLVILEGDHFIASKRPEAFNRTVMEFLARS